MIDHLKLPLVATELLMGTKLANITHCNQPYGHTINLPHMGLSLSLSYKTIKLAALCQFHWSAH